MCVPLNNLAVKLLRIPTIYGIV